MRVLNLALVVTFASIALTAASPAFADRDWQRPEHRERQEHEWREHHWRDHYYAPPVVVVPRYRYYAPPPVYYNPPGYWR